MVSVIFIIGTIWDAVTDPIIGMWSDRTRTKPGRFRLLPISGRRRPFIFWGSVGLVCTSIAFWFPPMGHTSAANVVYGVLLICLHWTVFTVTVVPINALQPEIARSEAARVRIGIWVAVGLIVGLAVAMVLPGKLITLLDPARAENGFSSTGYRRVAVVFAFISFILLQFPVWLVRERYDSSVKPQEHVPIARGYLEAVRNRPFIVYSIAFFFFNAGFLAAQNVLPYWAELGLGGDEGTVTLLMIPFILSCLLFFLVVPSLARRLHTKWMMCLAFFIIASGLPWMYVVPKLGGIANVKLVGGVLFAYVGMGQAIMYVMNPPIMGEIIDYDETRTGKRREALFQGLCNVAGKAAIAFSVLLSTQCMHLWGNSAERHTGVLLVGPFAAVLAGLGLVAMLFYPVLTVARRPEGK
jgi:GPH family glycoside/pentoside/hexuronide:cation symporter